MVNRPGGAGAVLGVVLSNNLDSEWGFGKLVYFQGDEVSTVRVFYKQGYTVGHLYFIQFTTTLNIALVVNIMTT